MPAHAIARNKLKPKRDVGLICMHGFRVSAWRLLQLCPLPPFRSHPEAPSWFLGLVSSPVLMQKHLFAKVGDHPILEKEKTSRLSSNVTPVWIEESVTPRR